MKNFYIFIFLLFLMSGCSQTIYPNHKLEDSLNKVLEKDNLVDFNLKTFAKFNWDKAYIIAPYTTVDQIEKKLGFKYNGSARMDSADHANLLVFIDNNTVVQIAEVSREFGDIYTDNKEEYIKAENPIVKIKRH